MITRLKSAVVATAVLAVAGTMTVTTSASANEPVRVVATFSILGDMIKNVGGDRVAVTTLVKAGGDPHVYQPTPADANAIARADLLIENGLNFEGWMVRLIKATDYSGPRVIASKGVKVRELSEEHAHHHHGHGDDHGHKNEAAHKDEHGHKEKHAQKDDHGHKDGHAHKEAGHDDDHASERTISDPHAWLDPNNGKIYVKNIRDGLCRVDSDGCATYTQNAENYAAQLTKLDGDIRAMFTPIAKDKRTVIISHDAFGYFGDTYGLTLLAPLGLSTDAEASAKDVVELIRQVRKSGAHAAFVENIADPRLIQQIARETGLKISGTLYPGSLSGLEGPAGTYLKQLRHNAQTISSALIGKRSSLRGANCRNCARL